MTQNEIKIPAFFAENGLTATSANHLSNIAKENYMAIERQLAKLEFYRTAVGLIGGSEETIVSCGTGPERFSRIRKCRFVRNRSREVLPDKEMGRGGMRMQEPDSIPAGSYQGQGQAYEGFG